MGIPGYFARAIKARPRSVSRAAPGIKRLFLDFNSAVHQGVVPGATAESVIEGACETLREIVARANPSEMFFLSIDGVAPLAKVNQQRSRRFLSHKARLATSFGRAPGDSFDRNAITPGTEFMGSLARRLKEECEEIAASRGIRSVFSGSAVPGEGEHKIMDHIRRNRPPPGQGSADCVYGLDADLILLSMVVRAQTGACPCIVREAGSVGAGPGPGGESEGEGGYVFLDVESLIDEVLAEAPAGLSDRDKVMNHVVASFLVGNDFLPPISCQSIKLGCLERMCRRADRPLCGPSYEINWDALAELVRGVADEEDEFFQRQDSRYWCMRPPDTSDPVALWEAFPVVHKDAACKRIKPGAPGWRPRYYDALFQTRDVEGVVGDYLAGVQWTMNYYAGEYARATPEWIYPHAYGPTALDVYNHLAAGSGANVRAKLRALPAYGFSAEAALLMVTPPSSFQILSPKLRALATDLDFGIAHTFPRDFGVHTYLRRWAHECKAKVPPVDLAAVKKLPIYS